MEVVEVIRGKRASGALEALHNPNVFGHLAAMADQRVRLSVVVCE